MQKKRYKVSPAEKGIIYSLVEHINLSTEHFASLKLSESSLKIYSFKNKKRQLNSDAELKEVSGPTFAKIIEILQKHDNKFMKNLDAKDDYSSYYCYVVANGTSGFCVNKETSEFCNFFSVKKGLGTKLLNHALENYDCYGMANALPETYESYYQGKFDVITHHWEENWDYPGDKSKAIWYGYILPKNTLSEENKVQMLRDGELLREKALSKEKIEENVFAVSRGRTTSKFELSEKEADHLNKSISGLDERKEEILYSALEKCYSTVKTSQVTNCWEEYKKTLPSHKVIKYQINEMWNLHKSDENRLI